MVEFVRRSVLHCAIRCDVKKKFWLFNNCRNSLGRWKKSQQEENIETEICGTNEKEAQAEMKKQQNTTSSTKDVSMTIKLESENGEPS